MEDRPHKFQPGPGWSEVSGMDSHPQDSASYQTAAEYDSIDKELGREQVMEVLGDYLAKQEEALEVPIEQNTGITGSEPMEVESQDTGASPDTADLPWHCRSSYGHSAGLLYRDLLPDITKLGYSPTLCNTQGPPPSLVTA